MSNLATLVNTTSRCQRSTSSRDSTRSLITTNLIKTPILKEEVEMAPWTLRFPRKESTAWSNQTFLDTSKSNWRTLRTMTGSSQSMSRERWVARSEPSSKTCLKLSSTWSSWSLRVINHLTYLSSYVLLVTSPSYPLQWGTISALSGDRSSM